MDLKNLSNTQLVKRCAGAPHDEQAWREFYERFDEHLRLIILRECRQKSLTQNAARFAALYNDLVQETYLKLVQKNCKALREYQAPAETAIYTYLAIIARNAVRGYVTRENAKKRRANLVSLNTPVTDTQEDGDLQLIDILPASEPGPDDNIDKESERRELDLLLNKIVTGKSKNRDLLIFKLHYFEAFSPEQMAEHCGIPLSAKRISNIITEIKQQIAEALSRPPSKIS